MGENLLKLAWNFSGHSSFIYPPSIDWSFILFLTSSAFSIASDRKSLNHTVKRVSYVPKTSVIRMPNPSLPTYIPLPIDPTVK